jgi:hypothetical protein
VRDRSPRRLDIPSLPELYAVPGNVTMRSVNHVRPPCRVSLRFFTCCDVTAVPFATSPIVAPSSVDRYQSSVPTSVSLPRVQLQRRARDSNPQALAGASFQAPAVVLRGLATSCKSLRINENVQTQFAANCAKWRGFAARSPRNRPAPRRENGRDPLRPFGVCRVRGAISAACSLRAPKPGLPLPHRAANTTS